MHAEIVLPADVTGPGTARRFVVSQLSRWGFQGSASTAALVVSELVTNAVLHARTEIRVGLHSFDGLLRIEVADGSERDVLARKQAKTSSTGRGLSLVAQLATSWGVERVSGGKCVWAVLPAQDADLAAVFEND